jgi:predicted thioesterase
MKTGLKNSASTKVGAGNTAAAMGSGDLPVFATPAMIALMENTAAQAVRGELSEGSTTVGTVVNVMHARATGLGDTVTATAELREIEGRKLIFHVSASDSKGIIGEGIHERVIVDTQRFMSKIG